MADPISCEGWDTGKPFLGVPSKFVVINEDGEEIGTLDELIPFLMLVSNNLSDIENAVEARNNLGVYSKEEIDDAIPDASTEVKGLVKLNDTVDSSSTTEAATAAQVKSLSDRADRALCGNRAGAASITRSGRGTGTYYAHPRTMFVSIVATLSTAGASIFLNEQGIGVTGQSNPAASSNGKVVLSAVLLGSGSYMITVPAGVTVTFDIWRETY